MKEMGWIVVLNGGEGRSADVDGDVDEFGGVVRDGFVRTVKEGRACD